MIAIDKVPVPESTGEGLGSLTYKDGKVIMYEHGSIANVYLFHETDDDGVVRALEITMDVPMTRDKCINAAEMAVYGLRNAMEVAAFASSLARKVREGVDLEEVQEHDRFMAEVRGELDILFEGKASSDTTQYKPYEYVIIEKMKKLMQSQIAQQTDEEALENIELFPTWQSKLGVQVQQGERLYYDDRLYKVLQTHTPQDDWRPDATASLYVQVVADDSGTESNPIEYQLNMELVEGKYYTEDSVKYRCIRSLAQSVWHLADLVGNYVEVV